MRIENILGKEVKKKCAIPKEILLAILFMLKNITTLGEGGMLYFKNCTYKNFLKQMRHNGHCDFDFKEKGIGFQQWET